MPDAGTLRSRTLASARWAILRLAVTGGMSVLQLAVLSRILEPSDFGEVSIVVVVLTLCDIFSQTGIDAALVRHRSPIEPLLDSAWSLQIARGGVLALLIAAAAGPVAALQGSPQLFLLLLAASPVPLIDGFRSMAMVIYTRELRQRPLVLAEVAAACVAFISVVILALWLRSPWALVINLSVLALLRVAFSYVIHPHRPRWTRRWGGLRPFVRFGLFFNLAGGVGYLLQTLDKVVIGSLLGMYVLGLYDRAFILSNFAVLLFPRFGAAVVFPGFSILLERPDRFRVLARRYLALISIAFAGGATLLFLFARPVLLTAAGPKFAAALPAFRVLLVFTAFRGITVGIQGLFDVVNRPHLRMWGNLGQLTVLLALLPIGASYAGLEGCCGAVSTAAVAGFLIASTFAAMGGLRPTRPAPQTPAAEEPQPSTTSAGEAVLARG